VPVALAVPLPVAVAVHASVHCALT
jgi:hypothetical protein